MINKTAEAELLRLAELEVAKLIEVAHKQGLNYWQLMDIFLRASYDLHLKASVEYYMKGG